MSTITTYHKLRGLADTSPSALRYETFLGETYLVVPVVCLVGNSVVWPMGAKGPEFVPAEELSILPESWNNRPCVTDHPEGGTSSANKPHILEAMGFGMMFNTVFDDGLLKTEAWLSLSRGKELGGDAQSVIDRCLANELVEVSVGAWVTAEEIEGEYDGKHYISVWRDVISDHLALLPEGVKGACSVEMGCGAPRMAKEDSSSKRGLNMPKALKTSTGGDKEDTKAKDSKAESIKLSATTMPKPSTLSSLDYLPSRVVMDALSSSYVNAEDDGTSDVELRDALWSAIRAIVPGFDWIVKVYPETKKVVYSAMPTDNEYVYYKRSYNLSESGEVTLNDDEEIVEPVTRYEPVAAAEGENKDKPCGCHKNLSGKKNDNKGENQMAKSKKDLIAELVSNSRSIFQEKDTKALEAMEEDRLQELVDEYSETAEGEDKDKKVEVKTETKVETKTETKPDASTTNTSPTPEPTELTEEEYLKRAPESLRAMYKKYQAAEQAHRTSLISALKDGQKVYSEEKLKGMSTERLEEIAQLVNLSSEDDTSASQLSYLSRGLPTNPTVSLSTPKPRDPYGLNKEKPASTN